MDIFNQFWVPRKIYKPCGMFTEGHMILLLISVCVLTFFIDYFNKNNGRKN